ncbi:hypothetical protein SAMN04488135_11424 [Pollutimonas bauzanensis]|uniref:Uncharacterized protein n=2 Tax=Pollutimonas bauzanensis TaxID=658167 RepID=A0A1M5ZE96_9BURK|nr:hypothetical protein SAMN04488135_11424 [Pollutimonas bauzanensis]
MHVRGHGGTGKRRFRPMTGGSDSPDWSGAPEGWNWAAQDEDGRWFWYGVKPVPGIGGGVWRAPSRAQAYAGQGAPNPEWYESLRERPG